MTSENNAYDQEERNYRRHRTRTYLLTAALCINTVVTFLAEGPATAWAAANSLLMLTLLWTD